MATQARRDELRAAIRAGGLRATPSRMAVLELLQGCAQPISHAEVVARLSAGDWDAATLYRNLSDFVEAGLLRRTDVGDHVWRFAVVRDDHDSAAHPHFVCTSCGSVACLPTLELAFPRAKVPRAIRRGEVEVHVRGCCDACAASRP